MKLLAPAVVASLGLHAEAQFGAIKNVVLGSKNDSCVRDGYSLVKL